MEADTLLGLYKAGFSMDDIAKIDGVLSGDKKPEPDPKPEEKKPEPEPDPKPEEKKPEPENGASALVEAMNSATEKLTGVLKEIQKANISGVSHNDKETTRSIDDIIAGLVGAVDPTEGGKK